MKLSRIYEFKKDYFLRKLFADIRYMAPLVHSAGSIAVLEFYHGQSDNCGGFSGE